METHAQRGWHFSNQMTFILPKRDIPNETAALPNPARYIRAPISEPRLDCRSHQQQMATILEKAEYPDALFEKQDPRIFFHVVRHNIAKLFGSNLLEFPKNVHKISINSHVVKFQHGMLGHLRNDAKKSPNPSLVAPLTHLDLASMTSHASHIACNSWCCCPPPFIIANYEFHNQLRYLPTNLVTGFNTKIGSPTAST